MKFRFYPSFKFNHTEKNYFDIEAENAAMACFKFGIFTFSSMKQDISSEICAYNLADFLTFVYEKIDEINPPIEYKS